MQDDLELEGYSEDLKLKAQEIAKSMKPTLKSIKFDVTHWNNVRWNKKFVKDVKT